jgi:hypothetical protein
LRGELAKHMERAQAAEDRIATLEADVAAATRGIATVPQERASAEAAAPEPTPPTAAPAPVQEPASAQWRPQPGDAQAEAVPPAPAGDDRYDDMWTTVGREPEAEAAPDAEPEPARASDQAPEAEPEDAPSGEDESELSPDDMWSLRARLADAAARKRQNHI